MINWAWERRATIEKRENKRRAWEYMVRACVCWVSLTNFVRGMPAMTMRSKNLGIETSYMDVPSAAPPFHAPQRSSQATSAFVLLHMFIRCCLGTTSVSVTTRTRVAYCSHISLDSFIPRYYIHVLSSSHYGRSHFVDRDYILLSVCLILIILTTMHGTNDWRTPVYIHDQSWIKYMKWTIAKCLINSP